MREERTNYYTDGVTVIIDRPPNFEAIRAVFPLAEGEGVVFAYGDRIYNPGGEEIPNALMQHELAHCKRQVDMDGGVEAWWDLYLTDGKFRYDEELVAHKAEYNALKAEYAGKGQNKKILEFVAGKLVAPLYGFTVGLNRAMRDIRGY